MLSAAATPLAGRASHFAAQSQSHRQGREETSAERTVGPSGRSSRNAPRPDGRSDVVVCFYVFGLYHSFMMKKTIYRTCLFGRTGPRKMVHADSTLAPILPRHGDGRGFGGQRRSGSNRDETRECPLPSFLLRCFDFALSGGRARAGVRPRCASAFAPCDRFVWRGSGAVTRPAPPFSYHKVSQRFLHLTIV